MQKVFKIRRALALPLLLDTVLLAILLAITILRNGTTAEITVLLVGLVPLILISIELWVREVAAGEAGLQVRKLLRRKVLQWGEITHVGAVILYKKVYLVLTTTKGFYIISNAYGRFGDLVREIVNRVEKDRIEENVAALIDTPVKKVSDVLLSWVAAFVLAGVIVFKLIG